MPIAISIDVRTCIHLVLRACIVELTNFRCIDTGLEAIDTLILYSTNIQCCMHRHLYHA